MNQKRVILNILRVLALGVLILVFLNGMTFHEIPENDLDKVFLEKVKENGLEAGKILLNEVHGNSCTFLFENDKGERACGTYSKSLYGRRWKEEKFFTSKMGILESGETSDISYDVNDKLTVYEVTCQFGDEPKVTFGKDKTLVLSVKTFGVCVVLMAGFAGRMIATRRRNNIN